MSDNSPLPASVFWSELMAGYVLGDLIPAEIEQVEAYLLAHPESQAEIASLMLPLDLLPLTLPADRPPASLRSQILQAATTEPAADFSAMMPVSQMSQVRRKSMPLWKPIAMGLELLAIGWLGWYNYHLSQELATVKQDLQTAKIAKPKTVPAINDDRSLVSLLQQPNNRFVTLKNMPQNTGAGNLIVVPNKSIALLVLSKVAPLPSGQVYRTWAIMGDEEMSCADFLPDKNGKVFVKIPLDSLKKATKVMVTIEQKSAQAAAGEVTIEGEI